MANVLHIVDAETPPDMLDQLNLLAGGGERVVSVGAAPLAELAAPVTAVHRPFGSAVLAGWRMRALAENADLLHAWSIPAARAGRELSLATGRPLVASLPGLPARRDRRETLRRAVGPGLLTVTVPTEWARRALLARGLPDASVEVLPPAAEPLADRSAARRRARRALGAHDGEPIVVVPESMVRGAGHRMASWAHAIVRHVLEKPVLLLLPGGGPAADRVRSFAHTTGFDDELRLPGDRLSRAEALAAADVAVFFHERPLGPIALSAAMAAGLPVAASRTPELAECAPHEEAALLARTGDPRQAAAAMLRLLEDADLASGLAAGAARRARERFDPGAGRRRLEAIYAAAMAGATP